MQAYKQAVRRVVVAEEELASAEHEIDRLTEHFRANLVALQALQKQQLEATATWKIIAGTELFESIPSAQKAAEIIAKDQDAIRSLIATERVRAESARVALLHARQSPFFANISDAQDQDD